MDCEHVQARLSEYLDRSLDQENAGAIEGHLSSCSACRLEADRLAAAIGLISKLPSVEPPADFAAAVMARVRQEAAKPSLWERLFSPLTLKLPIHATALVLIAGFALYLYRDAPPLQEEFRDSHQELPASPPPPEEAPPLLSKRAKLKDQAVAPKIAPERKNETVSPAAPASEAPEPKSEAASSLAPSAAAKPLGQLAPVAHYELVVRLHAGLERDEPDRKGAFRGLVLEREDRSARPADELKERLRSSQEKTQSESQVFWVGMPRGQYGNFKTDIAAWGTIESESAAQRAAGAREESQETVQVKITVLPPKDKPGPPSR